VRLGDLLFGDSTTGSRPAPFATVEWRLELLAYFDESEEGEDALPPAALPPTARAALAAAVRRAAVARVGPARAGACVGAFEARRARGRASARSRPTGPPSPPARSRRNRVLGRETRAAAPTVGRAGRF